MSNNNLVSIVIPYFNRSHAIRRAIESVLNQSHNNWELIVIDDGSESRESISLFEYIEDLNDGRILLIPEGQNRGGGHARNVGVLAATGDYIAFLDSDDEWAPNKLELQLKLHKNKGDLLISYTKSIIKYGIGSEMQEPIPEIAINPNDKIADYLFVKGGFMPTPSLFGARSTLQKCLFDTSLRRHQDYDLLLTLESYGCSFKMLNEVLVTIHWEDVGTNAGTRFYCPEVSAKFVEDRKAQFSRRAIAAFRLNNVFAPVRVEEGALKAIYRGFWSDLLIVKHLRTLVFTLTILVFGSTRFLKYTIKLYKRFVS